MRLIHFAACRIHPSPTEASELSLTMSVIDTSPSLAREEILKFAAANKSVLTAMQRLLHTAARALSVPAAFSAFFNTEGVLRIHTWYGFDATSSEDSSFLLADRSFYSSIQIIPDASKCAPHTNDVWTTNGGVRFFASLPIKTSTNTLIGIFCILDSEPRKLSSDHRRLLQDFGHMASEAILLRFETSINRFAYRKVEAEHKSTKQQLERITSSLPLPFISVDEEGVVQQWNRACVDTFGYAQEEMEGQSLTDMLVPEEARETVKKLINRVYNRRRISGIELVLQDKSKNNHVTQCRLLPNYNAKGIVESCIIIPQVESNTSRADQTIKRTAAQQYEFTEELQRLKTAFLSNMSHEIRTPLTSIIGFADILGDQVDDANKEFTQLIETSAQRLMSTLSAVLDLAQLEGHSLEINPEPLNLEEHTREIVESFRPMAESKKLKLTLDCKPDTYSIARIDTAAQTRVIRNLVSNAIKFTRKGKIEVLVKSDDASVVIQVKDSGIGISKEFLPNIFDGFLQESSGIARAFTGSGLNLAITKRLIELGNGTIEVDSKKGKGTTFTVVYPSCIAEAIAA